MSWKGRAQRPELLLCGIRALSSQENAPGALTHLLGVPGTPQRRGQQNAPLPSSTPSFSGFSQPPEPAKLTPTGIQDSIFPRSVSSVRGTLRALPPPQGENWPRVWVAEPGRGQLLRSAGPSPALPPSWTPPHQSSVPSAGPALPGDTQCDLWSLPGITAADGQGQLSFAGAGQINLWGVC